MTVKLTNTGTEPIQLNDSIGISSTMLYYGVNQYEATSWVGEIEGPTFDDFPRQLVPGTSAEGTQLYSIESSGEDVLRYTFNPDPQTYTDHTFTDVQTLAR